MPWPAGVRINVGKGKVLFHWACLVVGADSQVLIMLGDSLIMQALPAAHSTEAARKPNNIDRDRRTA